MKKDIRRLTLTTALLLFWAGKARSQDETNPPTVLAEFTADPRAEAILLPVRVGGEERLFLLDTGSTLSVFDLRLSSGASIGEIPVSPPSGPPVEKGLYAAPEASVGGLDMRGSGPVLYDDFAQMRAVTDRSVWGVIGMQFLKRYIVQLDLDEGKVRFLDPRARPRADWGSAVPIRSGPGGIPAVAARIAGREPEDFDIDTGDNSGGDLDRKVFQRLFPRQRGARSKDLMFTGIESSPSARVSEVIVGGVSFHGIVFESADVSSLGLAFVRRSVITFDFPRGIMYLKAGKRIEAQEDADMSGLHLLRQDGRIAALAVDPGSPAAKAGMLNGDFIVDAGDIVALRRRLCSGDGNTVELNVLRGGRTIRVRLRLRKIL